MAYSKGQTIQALIDVNGIGAKTANKVWAKFKSGTAQKLIDSPELVAEAIRGVSLKRAMAARTNLLAIQKDQTVHSSPPPDATVLAAPVTARAPVGIAPHEVAANQPNAAQREFFERSEIAELRDAQAARWPEILEARRHAAAVLHEHEDEILAQPNVYGASIGFRRSTDNEDNVSKIKRELEVCIRIHVEKKIPPNSPVFHDERIATKWPKQIDGVPIDVCEMRFSTLEIPQDGEDDAAGAVAHAAVPVVSEPELIGGIEIATESFPTNRGTMGGVVFQGFVPMMITNAHVAKKGASVTQPGNGPVIGTVVSSEIATVSSPGPIDCSIIQSNNSREMEQAVKGLDPPQVFDKSELFDLDVHNTIAIMVGAVSGVQFGIVEDVSAVVKIGNAKMPNQILVESTTGERIIQAGDSGSWLLTRQFDQDGSLRGYNVVGLVHARTKNGRQIVATHFRDIARRFHVDINLPL